MRVTINIENALWKEFQKGVVDRHTDLVANLDNSVAEALKLWIRENTPAGEIEVHYEEPDNSVSRTVNEFQVNGAILKWRTIRTKTYETIRAMLSSPEKIDALTFDEFKENYLSMGFVFVGGKTHRLKAKYIFEQLDRLPIDSNVTVGGNCSWSRLERQDGLIRENWERTKEALKYLLYGADGRSINVIDEDTVYDRLERVLLGDLAVDGFKKGKITPLLLIFDNQDRFGVWNNQTERFLLELGYRVKSYIRDIGDYKDVNRYQKEVRDNNGLQSLTDVDMFVWYWLRTLDEL